MKKIFYKLSARLSIELEVPDIIAEFLEQEKIEDKRAKWREKKRRTTSIEYLEELNIQLASPNSNPLDILIEQESSHDFTWDLPLPPKHKQVIILRFRHGMTIRQIAENLGISKSTVSDYIQKSLKILRGDGQNMRSHSLYYDGVKTVHRENTEE